jgi:hexosaminidase
MPGHALAALSAYPNLGCTGGPYKTGQIWGVFDDVFCAGNDATFAFIEGVLDEVCALFPSTYIHVGGDECPKTRWEACPKCQQRMKTEGLKDAHELQSYFIHRAEAMLAKHGKKLIGWDEILEGGIAPSATIMSWRGIEGGIAAAKAGHDAIMTPSSNVYFDYYQSDPTTEPLAIGGYLPLDKVYGYEPVPEALNAAEAKHILGVQAKHQNRRLCGIHGLPAGVRAGGSSLDTGRAKKLDRFQSKTAQPFQPPRRDGCAVRQSILRYNRFVFKW